MQGLMKRKGGQHLDQVIEEVCPELADAYNQCVGQLFKGRIADLSIPLSLANIVDWQVCPAFFSN